MANPAPNIGPAIHANYLRGLKKRKRILELIAGRALPWSTHELADELGCSQATVTHHLGLLKNQGLADWFYNRNRTLHLTPAGEKALETGEVE